MTDTDAIARAIPPETIILKTIHELATPVTRDQILGRIAVSHPDYVIEPAHATQHLGNLEHRGFVTKLGNPKQPRYRVTSAGATELGPLAQTPEQPWDDEGRLREGAPATK